MNGQTKFTIKDSDHYDFSELAGQTAMEALCLENVSSHRRLDQLPHLSNLKTMIIDSCLNLVSLEGLKEPRLTHLYIKHYDAFRDYTPLNEVSTLENPTIHTGHASLNGLRRASSLNLTVFVMVEGDNGSYQKCFRAESDSKAKIEEAMKRDEL